MTTVKSVKGDILVKKHVGTEAEWLDMYRAYERANQTRHISERIAQNVVKAAAALAESGYSGPVAVLDPMTASAELEAGNGAVRLLYVGENCAIVTDPKGEIAQAQELRAKARQLPYAGGL